MLRQKNHYHKIGNIELKFNSYKNILYLYNNYSITKIFLPSFYFYSHGSNYLNFIYLNKFFFINIMRQLLNYFRMYVKFYFFKLRLRGLGYKLKKYAIKLYRFFFAYNHYFYFHVPKDIFVKNRKRTLLVFGNNKAKLNDIFSHLLLLKKLDLYDRNNSFIVSRQIKFFKKRK
jgi:hypothetical protein